MGVSAGCAMMGEACWITAEEGWEAIVTGSSVADGQVHAARLTAQLLAGETAASAAEAVGRLLAVQGQDQRGARLAVRARTRGLTAADVDRALTIDRSLVITWVNRGTLHLIRSEDYWWLHRLTARPQFQVGSRRILARHGVSGDDADKGVAVVEQALAADGPLTRADLADRITAAGMPPTAGVALQVLILASLRGAVVRGPMIGSQHAYVHVRDWLGTPPPVPEPEQAFAWLARRYLAGHGPASDQDLAKWAGLPVSHVRRGLAAITAELRDRPDGLAELAASARPSGPSLPPPRLLGAYDPVLMGWVSRAPVVGDHPEIVTMNGQFRPFALVDGRAAGLWAWSDRQVKLEPFARLPEPVESAIEAEARDVQRFLAAGDSAVGDEDQGA